MTHFLDADGRPRALVVMASARTGSNLLVRYLRQVPPVACFGEILKPRFLEKREWTRLASRLKLGAEAERLHGQDPTAFWELVIGTTLRKKQWAGAKAFYWHRRGDPVWDRFAEDDHRVIHLLRDSTLDSFVSLHVARASGAWKALADDPDGEEATKGGGDPQVKVPFDVAEYLEYRATMATDVAAARERYDRRGHYVELEYKQLNDHDHIEDMLESLFGQRIRVEETLQRQRKRPAIDYLSDPADAEPFEADTLSGGFAPAPSA
jgi:hypothetical protein